MNIRIKFTIVLSLLPFVMFSQNNDSLKASFNANYTSDFGRNFTGGIKKGNFYLGLLNLALELPVFRNGQFYFQLQNTHGSLPSADYVGDLQTFSNIENGNYTYLYAAWYKHQFGKFSITFGVHDLNSEFNVSEIGAFYTNSSFGIQPSISWNMTASIFPKNTLGMILKYDFTDNLSIITGIYDGDPGNLSDDKYNLDLSIDLKNQGILNVTELQIKTDENQNYPRSFKFGYVYHSMKFCQFADSLLSKSNYGFYFISDWFLSQSSGLFLQLGWSPQNRNLNSIYTGLGISFVELGRSKRHSMGLAISYTNISKDFCKYISQTNEPFESTFEFFYKAKLSENISVQPDIQFIINPGIFTDSPNALVGFIRLSVNI